jgi:hypothetical protein
MSRQIGSINEGSGVLESETVSLEKVPDSSNVVNALIPKKEILQEEN